jgi:hypothetical protein
MVFGDGKSIGPHDGCGPCLGGVAAVPAGIFIDYNGAPHHAVGFVGAPSEAYN